MRLLARIHLLMFNSALGFVLYMKPVTVVNKWMEMAAIGWQCICEYDLVLAESDLIFCELVPRLESQIFPPNPFTCNSLDHCASRGCNRQQQLDQLH